MTGSNGTAPAVSAHRRDSAGVAGFERAVASGAEYVEIDIRRTIDGELVALHDSRLSGVPLAGLTYAQVGEAGHRPPRVREAMEVIAGNALGHLDLKERGGEHEAVELALEVLGPGNFVVTTKEVSSIKIITRDFPEVSTALSIGRSFWERGYVRDFSPVAVIRASGADMVALNYRLARLGVLAQCARAGFKAMIWTVNTEPDMRRFLRDPRVAVLITDHPKTALALRSP